MTRVVKVAKVRASENEFREQINKFELNRGSDKDCCVSRNRD